jgi:hypothetical protein
MADQANTLPDKNLPLDLQILNVINPFYGCMIAYVAINTYFDHGCFRLGESKEVFAFVGKIQQWDNGETGIELINIVRRDGIGGNTAVTSDTLTRGMPRGQVNNAVVVDNLINMRMRLLTLDESVSIFKAIVSGEARVVHDNDKREVYRCLEPIYAKHYLGAWWGCPVNFRDDK